MSFIEGLLLGLGTIVFIGPVFFVVLNSTLKHGKLAGIYVSVGIIISDIAYILLYKLALFNVIEKLINTTYAYYLFVIVLISFGLANLLKKHTPLPLIKTDNRFIIQLSSGFGINFFNPFVAVFWLGTFKYISLKYTEYEQWSFLGAALLGIFLIDLLKVFFSGFLKSHLTHKALNLIYKIIGGLFVLFGIILLLKTLD